MTDGVTGQTIVAAAAEGRLPKWTEAGSARRAHMDRVAEVLDGWAERMELPPRERARWRAAGRLHDVLRDAPPEQLRGSVPDDCRDLPDGILHGPAAAARLRAEGVDDEELLLAVAFHTLGDPRFGTLGRALYAADFLEPGRTAEAEWRASLREAAPDDLDRVVREVARARMAHWEAKGVPADPRSVAFWNVLTEVAD